MAGPLVTLHPSGTSSPGEMRFVSLLPSLVMMTSILLAPRPPIGHGEGEG